MLMSQVFAPTLREVPAEAEIASHQLMLRAGLIRKSVSGVYTYLPLGWRVIQKIARIVREEMDRQGGQELCMPILQPKELWQESGRWDVYGEEMFRLTDRHGREGCLGPTHEELVTSVVRDEVRSYRQLPMLLYQIQNKYRDEIRPRFGLMRSREFIMKDLYSFDRDVAGLKASYGKMLTAYQRIFARCGLEARAVEANAGAIGGSLNHEYMVLADSGEAGIVYCDECHYAANVEQAACPAPEAERGEVPAHYQEVATPGRRSIEEVSTFLGVPQARLVKTLFYEVNHQLVAVLLRGDQHLNELKLERALAATGLRLAEPEAVAARLSLPVGFVGPVGLAAQGVQVVADQAVPGMAWCVVGANKPDTHLTGVKYGRDFVAAQVADLREAGEGDPCPECGAPFKAARGIEVGHLFQLGTKYSVPLKAVYLDADGAEQPIVMGSYGIGIGRTAAAAIEQHHDADGITWPVAICPAHVIVVPVNAGDKTQMAVAQDAYQRLERAGWEVVLDDRDERPGVKFKDADLIGFPVRLTVGPKGLAQGAVEMKRRRSGESSFVPLADLESAVRKVLECENEQGAE